MEKYIKYKRIVKQINDDYDTQDFFDELITEGWEIIYYNEIEHKSTHPDGSFILEIITVVGKKQNNTL